MDIAAAFTHINKMQSKDYMQAIVETVARAETAAEVEEVTQALDMLAADTARAYIAISDNGEDPTFSDLCSILSEFLQTVKTLAMSHKHHAPHPTLN
jgi:hypothetical protein